MLWQFVSLLAVHWVADFVLQTHWQASNKSKNNEALMRHVGVYTLVLAIYTAIVVTPWFVTGIYFIVANGILHFITDYCTSRWSSRLYAKQDWHNFFVVVGFDQLIHQFTLAATMSLFFL